MKATNTNKRIRIGFKYWNNDEDDFIEETENGGGSPNVNNIGDIPVTSAHSEVIERLQMVEKVILGKSFAKMAKRKKLEFLAEQVFLRNLNEQLVKSYNQ